MLPYLFSGFMMRLEDELGGSVIHCGLRSAADSQVGYSGLVYSFFIPCEPPHGPRAGQLRRQKSKVAGLVPSAATFKPASSPSSPISPRTLPACHA